MNWLLTIKDDLSREQIESLVRRIGGELGQNPPIPLGAGEQAIAVTGPRDLPQKARSVGEVIQVYPNSDLTLL